MSALTAEERRALVAEAGAIISKGSQSFRAASRLFDAPTRGRAWLLYAWCRAADDLTDGQELGHDPVAPHDPPAAQARLEALTALALDTDDTVPPPFQALRQVAGETSMPRRFIADHLAGFALDAAEWRPRTEDDLLRYCYHVAGSVGCMMAVVMGVEPGDEDTLDRACDLGIAFQLANIARDLVADALVGRCYVPAEWLEEFGLTEQSLAATENRPALAGIAARLVGLARPYRSSARIGATRLAPRCRLAVLAADAIYGEIGEKVVRLGERAWDSRVRTGKPGKLALFAVAALRIGASSSFAPRAGLWTRQRQSGSSAGSRN